MLGIDPSTNMLVAARENSRPEIEFRQMFVEELALEELQYDLVVSSLMFHYIEDLKPVSEKIHSWLREGGSLVFLIEHPIVTAIQSKRTGWLKDDQGERIGWEVTDYSSEGKRVSRWIVDDVVKYHRTIATMINILADSGFSIVRSQKPASH